MAKHTYKLRVFEQPHKAPKTLQEAEENKAPKEIKLEPKEARIEGRNVDVCLKLAREFVEKKLKRVVRSVSIGPDGIYAVVYTETVKKGPKTMTEKRLMKGLPK